MQVHFYLRYHSRFGQHLCITGNIPELGSDDPGAAVQMNYLNDEFWEFTLNIKRKELKKQVSYAYLLRDDNGETVLEYSPGRVIEWPEKKLSDLFLIDTWGDPGLYENTFFTDAFDRVLLAKSHSKGKPTNDENFTHEFRVMAPLLKKNEVICLAGSGSRLGHWSEEKPVLMGRKAKFFSARLNLSGETFPFAYKYAIWQTREKKFIRYENGNNRMLYEEGNETKRVILQDGFVRMPNNSWKGAGVALPVFSLRSKKSFGTGEFTDLKLLARWAGKCGIRLIQILPVNDTTATRTWKDSYPYSSISAFALHPLYINLWKVAGKERTALLNSFKKKQKELNALPELNYEEVTEQKLSALKILFDELKNDCFRSEDYKSFFKENKHWLEPYALFCVSRDNNQTADFTKWPLEFSIYRTDDKDLHSPKNDPEDQRKFYYFIQYHLHLQLKEARDYAHKLGIILKGDVPIGISRKSCDAWIAPELYHMDQQAGAPPDDFTPLGQNWGFPTYNWKKMQEDGFAWWKARFRRMQQYFDAFRIDHILGFFRIWSIPEDAIQGIMGRFVPSIPVGIHEFGENGIWFNEERYCEPFIIDEIIKGQFEGMEDEVIEKFLLNNDDGTYRLQSGFGTQREVFDHFSELENSEKNNQVKNGLLNLLSNVILFEDAKKPGESFHFRFAVDKTSSFQHLNPFIRGKLKELYNDYFFNRQEGYWRKEAMQKLPSLKAATNMLICGEDLGVVPRCVPDVMKELGILSLEIQRMPKKQGPEFFIVDEAPYLSVVSPSTHDMSTIRGWWEENRDTTQRFYNKILGQWGEAPEFCEAWINRAIVLQHLYSPAMWSIFQWQDLVGMSETLRRDDPKEERINDPSNPEHYWRYRMHISLEDLVNQKEFNEELRGYIVHSDRGE